MKSRARAKSKQRPRAVRRRKDVKASKDFKASKTVKASQSARTAKAKPARARKAADPLDEFIAGAARTLGLKIKRAWLPAVRVNLRVTLAQAALVGEFALPDEAEPAPVFKA
jgi:1-carboxybiuret hydrolase subunit AtzG-like